LTSPSLKPQLNTSSLPATKLPVSAPGAAPSPSAAPSPVTVPAPSAKTLKKNEFLTQKEQELREKVLAGQMTLEEADTILKNQKKLASPLFNLSEVDTAIANGLLPSSIKSSIETLQNQMWQVLVAENKKMTKSGQDQEKLEAILLGKDATMLMPPEQAALGLVILKNLTGVQQILKALPNNVQRFELLNKIKGWVVAAILADNAKAREYNTQFTKMIEGLGLPDASLVLKDTNMATQYGEISILVDRIRTIQNTLKQPLFNVPYSGGTMGSEALETFLPNSFTKELADLTQLVVGKKLTMSEFDSKVRPILDKLTRAEQGVKAAATAIQNKTFLTGNRYFVQALKDFSNITSIDRDADFQKMMENYELVKVVSQNQWEIFKKDNPLTAEALETTVSVIGKTAKDVAVTATLPVQMVNDLNEINDSLGGGDALVNLLFQHGEAYFTDFKAIKDFMEGAAAGAVFKALGMVVAKSVLFWFGVIGLLAQAADAVGDLDIFIKNAKAYGEMKKSGMISQERYKALVSADFKKLLDEHLFGALQKFLGGMAVEGASALAKSAAQMKGFYAKRQKLQELLSTYEGQTGKKLDQPAAQKFIDDVWPQIGPEGSTPPKVIVESIPGAKGAFDTLTGNIKIPKDGASMYTLLHETGHYIDFIATTRYLLDKLGMAELIKQGFDEAYLNRIKSMKLSPELVNAGKEAWLHYQRNRGINPEINALDKKIAELRSNPNKTPAERAELLAAENAKDLAMKKYYSSREELVAEAKMLDMILTLFKDDPLIQKYGQKYRDTNKALKALVDKDTPVNDPEFLKAYLNMMEAMDNFIFQVQKMPLPDKALLNPANIFKDID
jgi:hypothetical protein